MTEGLGRLPTEGWRDTLATAGWLTLLSVDCLRGQPDQTIFCLTPVPAW